LWAIYLNEASAFAKAYPDKMNFLFNNHWCARLFSFLTFDPLFLVHRGRYKTTCGHWHQHEFP
jgi:hypothetical protein